MAEVTQSTFLTTPFKFVVQGREFYVHKAIIAKVSKPLERMINGPMSEAVNNTAVLQDEDADTFNRFCEWAYNNGNFYVAAKPSRRPAIDSDIVDLPEWDEDERKLDLFKDGSNSLLISRPLIPRSSKRPRLSTTGTIYKDRRLFASYLNAHPFPTPPRRGAQQKTHLKEMFTQAAVKLLEEYQAVQAPNDNGHWVRSVEASITTNDNYIRDDYSDVLLCHARLYVFADKYDVERLKKLTMYNLHQHLRYFNLSPQPAQDIVKLLDFVYNNTPKPTVGEEPMREMLCKYLAWTIESFLKLTKFRDLMETNRDFMDDVCDIMQLRT